MQLRVGMAALELLAQARHLRQADGVDGGYPHSAFGLTFEALQRHQELVLAPQNFAAEVRVEFARVGERQRPRAAIHQPQTQTAFQLLHVLGGCGLADAGVRGGPADTLGLGDFFEKLGFEKVQTRSL